MSKCRPLKRSRQLQWHALLSWRKGCRHGLLNRKSFNRATNSASCVQGRGAVRVLWPNPCTNSSLGSLLSSRQCRMTSVQTCGILRSFCRTRHGYIVFDHVNSMQFILSQRALMQSNSDVHSLGQSRTGIYQYSVYIFAVPIIMTVDHSC